MVLPSTPALRQHQITLQIALINALMHVKGYAAPETKAAAEQAGLLIEQAEALGEPPEDPLLLFSVLYGSCIASFNAFDGDTFRDLAAQFLRLAQRQKGTLPLLVAHRLIGHFLLFTGELGQGLAQYNKSLSLYDPVEHRPLSSRFGQDGQTTALCYRSITLWLLGSPKAALGDTDRALLAAREIAQASTLMDTLFFTSFTHAFCGNYQTATALLNELVALAEDKHAVLWTAAGMTAQGHVMALTAKGHDAVQTITAGFGELRSTGTTQFTPFWLSYLAKAHAELCLFDSAWRSIGDAMAAIETTNEKWFEAETNRIAGEIMLKSPERDTAKAQAYFERALAVAREQQAKSWELRASMSMARLWRDQCKLPEAREVLAPVYRWFTEGFDTGDLKEAKALLDELAA